MPAGAGHSRVHYLKNPPANKAGAATDDYSRLLSFSNSLYRDRYMDHVKWSLMFLPKEYRDHLEKHVPEANFESTENWIVALKTEVDTVLLPMVKGRRPDPRGCKAAAAEFLASDRMIEDLEVEEHLDANMDGALRRLFWLGRRRNWSARRRKSSSTASQHGVFPD
jgi:hypothetical protein